jgi:HAMP domain-containing protein
MQMGRQINRSIVWTLALTIGCATAVVLALNSWLIYNASRQTLIRETEAFGRQMTKKTAEEMGIYLNRLATVPIVMAQRHHRLGIDPDKMTIPFLADVLKSQPDEVLTAYYAYEHRYPPDPMRVPLVSRASYPNALPMEDTYDHHAADQEWYQKPKKTGALSITEPFYDAGFVNDTMVSITIPMYDQKNRFYGIAGVDIKLEGLAQRTAELRILRDEFKDREFAMLVSEGGAIIAHPNKQLLLRKDLDGTKLSQLPEGKVVGNTKNGYQRAVINGQPRYLFWDTVPTANWKLIVSVDEGAILAPLAGLRARAIGTTVLAIALMSALAGLLSYRALRPLREMTAWAKRASEGQGDLTQRLTIHRQDELGEFAGYFNRFMDRLQEMVQQVRQASIQIVAISRQVQQAITESSEGVRRQASETQRSSQNFVSELRQNVAAVAEFQKVVEAFARQSKRPRSWCNRARRSSPSCSASSVRSRKARNRRHIPPPADWNRCARWSRACSTLPTNSALPASARNRSPSPPKQAHKRSPKPPTPCAASPTMCNRSDKNSKRSRRCPTPSAKSCARLRKSPARRTCWHSTPRLRLPAQAKQGAGLRSLPKKCVGWQSAARTPRATSSASFSRCWSARRVR